MIRGLFVVFLLCASSAFGQGDDQLYDHQLDEDKWEQLREGIRYEGQEGGPGRRWTYESEREYREAERRKGNGGGTGGGNGTGDGPGNGAGDGAPQNMPDYTPPPRSPSMNVSPMGGFGIIGWILLGVLVAFLIFLIYKFFLNSKSNKGKKITAEIEALEDVNPTEIPLSELQRLLQEALSRGDFRGAVRIYFIFIIRDLAEKQYIKWEKEKTNFHYLREMSGKTEFDDFNRSVSFFEFIWYGQRELDQSTFDQVKPNFTRFLDKLGVR